MPIFRLASSGISQLVDRSGRVRDTAPFPGDGAIIEGELELRDPGRLPVDRWLAPASTLLTMLLVCGFAIPALESRCSKSGQVEELERPAARPAGAGCGV